MTRPKITSTSVWRTAYNDTIASLRRFLRDAFSLKSNTASSTTTSTSSSSSSSSSVPQFRNFEQMKLERNLLRTRIKWSLYGLFGVVAAGAPLYRAYLGDDRTRMKHKSKTQLKEEEQEVHMLRQKLLEKLEAKPSQQQQRQ